jgi:hypothetical protein
VGRRRFNAALRTGAELPGAADQRPDFIQRLNVSGRRIGRGWTRAPVIESGGMTQREEEERVDVDVNLADPPSDTAVGNDNFEG